MSRERSFRGSRDGRERELDWYALARERGIPHRQAQRIYDAARELAGQQGEDQVREIYLGLLEQAHPASRRPSPGKITHTMRRQSRKHRRAHKAGPGKVTLTSYLGLDKGRSGDAQRAVELPAEAREMLAWLTSMGQRIDGARASQALRDAVENSPENWFDTVLDLVLGRLPAGQRPEGMTEGANADGAAPAEQGPAMPLPDDIRARMERIFGQDFRHVQIVPDSDRATGATHAVTQGSEIHFAHDRFQPGTNEGDWLIGHELAHVVQGMGRAGTRQAPSRRSLEVEADQAATLAARGQAAHVSMYAPAGAAMAYSETEAEQREREEEEERRRREEQIAREQQQALEAQLRGGQAPPLDREGQTPITQIPTMIGVPAAVQAAVQAGPSFAIESMNVALRESPISPATHAHLVGEEAARAAISEAELSVAQSLPEDELAFQAEDVLAEVSAGPDAAAAEVEAALLGSELGAELGVGPDAALAAGEQAEGAPGEAGQEADAAAEGAAADAATDAEAEAAPAAEGEARAEQAAEGDAAQAEAVQEQAAAGEAAPGAAMNAMIETAAMVLPGLGMGVVMGAAATQAMATAQAPAPAPVAPAQPQAAAAPARPERPAAPARQAPAATPRPAAQPVRPRAATPPQSMPTPSDRGVALAPVASSPRQEPDPNAETVVQPNVPLSHQSPGGGAMPAIEPVTPDAAAAAAGVDIGRQRDVASAIAADPQVSAQRQQAQQAAGQIASAGQQPQTQAPAPVPASAPAGPSANTQAVDARRQAVTGARSIAQPQLPATPASPHLPDAAGAPAANAAPAAAQVQAASPIDIAATPMGQENLPGAPPLAPTQVAAATAAPQVPAPQPAPMPRPAGDNVPNPASLAGPSVSADADRQAHRVALAGESATSSVVPEQDAAARAAQVEPLPGVAQQTYVATTEAPHAQIQAGEQAGSAAVGQQAQTGQQAQSEDFNRRAGLHTAAAAQERALGQSQPPAPALAHTSQITAAVTAATAAVTQAVQTPPAAQFTPPAATAARAAAVQGMVAPEPTATPTMPETEAPQGPEIPDVATATAEAQAQADAARASIAEAELPAVNLQAPSATTGTDRRSMAIAQVERDIAAQAQAQVGPAMETAAAPARQQLVGELDRATAEAQAHVADVQAQAAQTQAELQAEQPPVDQAQLDAQAQAQWDAYQAQADQATTQAQTEVTTAESAAQAQHAVAEQGYQQSVIQAQAQQQAAAQTAQSTYEASAAQAEATSQASQQAAQTQLEADQAAAEATAQQQRAQAEAETQANIAQSEAQHQAQVQAAEAQYQAERQAVEQQNQAEVQRLQAESQAQSQQTQAQMQADVAQREAQGNAQSNQLLGQGEQAYQSEVQRGQAEADAQRARAEQEAAAKRAQAEEERNKGRSIFQKAVDFVGGLVSDLLDAAANILRAARDAVMRIMEAARQAALNALNRFRELAQQALRAAMDAIQSVIKAAADAIRAIIQAAADAIKAAIQAAAQALQAVVQALTNVVNGLLETLQTMVNAALDGLIAVVGMIDQEWAQSLADATSGFRAAFNAAVDQLQADIQTASDGLQDAIGQAADAMCETVDAAAQVMQDAVTAVEETLHNAVEAAYNVASAAIDMAFDAAEAAVNTMFDLAETAVKAWFDAQIGALELAADLVDEATKLAVELVGMAIEAITAPFKALVELMPDFIIEGFIDFWNSEWREMIVIGLVSIAALAITVGTLGAGAPLGALLITGALVGGAMGGAAYFGGEMIARQGEHELFDRNGQMYVPGQGYVNPQDLIDPATGQLRADLPPEMRDQAQWALSNFHVNPDGTVRAKTDQELFDLAVSEGIEGAVIGGISGAASVAGFGVGGRVANALAGRGVGMVTRALAQAGVEGVIDVASGGLTAGATHFIEAIESGQSLGEAATGALQTLRDQTLSPQAILTAVFTAGIGGAGKARFVDDRFTGRFAQQAADISWDTVSGVLSEAGGSFTGTLIQELSRGTPLDQAVAKAREQGAQAFDPRNMAVSAGLGVVGSRFDPGSVPGPAAGGNPRTPGTPGSPGTPGGPGTPGTAGPASSTTTRPTASSAPDTTTRPTSGPAPDTTAPPPARPTAPPPSTTAPPANRPTRGPDTTLPTPATRPPAGTSTPPRPTPDASSAPRPTPAPDTSTPPRPPTPDASSAPRPTPAPDTSAPPRAPDAPAPRPDTTVAPPAPTPVTDTTAPPRRPTADPDTTALPPPAPDATPPAPGPTPEGISGGKVTREDFLGAPATDADINRVRQQSDAENNMSLDDQAASLLSGTARSERDMLISIQNGDLPRFIARVGPTANFDRGTFANPNRPFAFAAEPADLRGVSPAEAMYKVGWTREWIEPNIGKEITITVLDTNVPVADASGGSNRVEMGRMEWAELKATALGDSNFRDAAESRGITAAELPALFDIAASTPVHGAPATSDPDQAAKVQILRGLIDRSYGANDLYTGMGATMRDDGQLGGREIMLRPNGTGLALTPDNHRKVSLGVMTQEHFDALFPPSGASPSTPPPTPDASSATPVARNTASPDTSAPPSSTSANTLVAPRTPGPDSNASTRPPTGPDAGASNDATPANADATRTPANNNEPQQIARQAEAALSEPPPLQRQVDQVTGVDKGPEYERAQQELRDFYRQMEVEAQQVTEVRGRMTDGPYAWQFGGDVQEFSHGVMNVRYRVYLDGSSNGISAADLDRLRTNVVQGVDQHYNFRHTVQGASGQDRRLHLEVEFVDNPANAHLNVTVHQGSGRANLSNWFVGDSGTVHAHEIGHGAFGLRDEYVDGSVPNRATPTSPGVSNDQSLMGNFWIRDANGNVVPDPRTRLQDRHLGQISGDIASHQRAAIPPPTPGPTPAPSPSAPTTNPGITGGRVTHGDFLGTPTTDADRTRVRQQGEAENAMSLDDQAASLTSGTARSERDMLISIENGEVPRFLARVGGADNFSRGTFANPTRPFAFAAEPADLRGVSPAEAMYKVGWTREWIQDKIGQEILVAVFDTTVPVADASGGSNTIEMGRMEWPELKAAALADQNFLDAAEARGISAAELPALFDIAARTPVRGTPDTADPDQAGKVAILRGLIDRSYGANELYTGMGATLRDDGQLGGREIMMRPNGTNLALTPDNHRMVSLGVMTQDHFDALFPPAGSSSSAPPAPQRPDADTSNTPPAPSPVADGATSTQGTDADAAPNAPSTPSGAATNHVKSVAGSEATAATRKYVFDAAEQAAVSQRVRDKAQAAGEQAYDAAIANGRDEKQAKKEANKAVQQTAKAEAKAEAERAARDAAHLAIANGSAFDSSKLDADSQAQLANYQSGSLAAKRLGPALAGQNDAGFLAVMAHEVSAGLVPSPRPINLPGPPPQQMQMWEYSDGTVVRYKPLGDSQRPNPTFSIEVKKDPSQPDSGQDDAAFKVDGSGNPVPKGPYAVANPYSLASNADQFRAFERAIMDLGHHSLVP